MSDAPKNWKVVRDCCTSGNCIDCNGVTPLGEPLRVVHARNVDEQWAKTCARNFARYNAVAMPANQSFSRRVERSRRNTHTGQEVGDDQTS